MPEMDGYELARQILALQKGWRDQIILTQTLGGIKMKRECPVVAVTAFTDESVRKKSIKIGMKSVINKPVQFDQLKSILEEFYFDKQI